jgi:hypothetical protein
MIYLRITLVAACLLLATCALLTKKNQGIPEAVGLLGFALVSIGGDVFPVIGALFILAFIYHTTRSRYLARKLRQSKPHD